MRFHIPALLLASSLLSATAFATPPAAVDAQLPPVRISTGVKSPVLLNGSSLSISSEGLAMIAAPAPTTELWLHVDEKGAPSAVRIVKPVNAKVDAQVLAMARTLRFRPAMLDHQAVPMDLRVEVTIQR